MIDLPSILSQTLSLAIPIFGILLPVMIIFVVFYFLLIRPQQKKLKDHKNMIANLKKGDRIVTQGGIIGNIHYVNDDGTLSVEIADNVNVKVAKGMVADIAAK